MASSRSGPALSNSATISASLVASATMAVARPPAATISVTTVSSAGLVRPATRTFKPSAANRLQSCAPKPWSGPTPMMIAVAMAAAPVLRAQRSRGHLYDDHHDYNRAAGAVTDVHGDMTA